VEDPVRALFVITCLVVLVVQLIALVRWYRAMGRMAKLDQGWDHVNRRLDDAERKRKDDA